MFSKIMLMSAVTALVTLLTPSGLNAYGACHVGYTHVGPNGVYHEGSTAVSRPGGNYGHTTEGYHTTTGYGGAAYGGYHYSAGYSGNAAYGSAHYAYVR